MLTVRSDSLYGRIVHRYFGFGLTCIGLLLACSIASLWGTEGSTPWLMLAALVVPFTVLWLGGLQLRRVLTTPEQILSQLVRLSSGQTIDRNTLLPITDAEPAAAGWNHLLQHLQTGALSPQLEKKLAAALQVDNDSRMTNVLNSIGDGIAVTDADGSISYGNFAFAAVLRIPADESLTDKNIHTLLRGVTGDGQLPDALSHGEVTRLRVEVSRSQDESDGVLRITCDPEFTEQGEADNFVWTIRDITQQKLAEKMRTEFVETATHELRTPLANIRAYAETLELTDDIPVEQQKEFVNIINGEATRLSRFVDELLNLSQMDAGQITISKHETDFERLLQECIEHTRPQMQAKSMEFETRIPAKLPSLQLDKDKMASCLVNLLGNAAKYTPEDGKVTLIVEQTATELSIRVEDTGFGIAEEELPRVFHRFFRSNDDRVREESGSGLGLAYTHEVVRLHGGRLTVESELNQGSQFTLCLPL